MTDTLADGATSTTDETAGGNGALSTAGGFVALTWNVTYADGASHRVTTRPGDYGRLAERYPNWKAAGSDNVDPNVMLFLAWCASRHDPTGLARPDFDTFRDDAVTIEMDRVAPRPTGAAAGNGSPSSWQLPPEPTLPSGSPPIPTPS